MAGKQSRGPKVLAWNDEEIPLTQEGFGGRKQIGINFTIADCTSEGFSRYYSSSEPPLHNSKP
jgi:hypothetical protein